MLRGAENISRQEFSGYSLFPHAVYLVELCAQIVMYSEIVRIFYECCDKMVRVLMIDVGKDISEIHMEEFLGILF